MDNSIKRVTIKSELTLVTAVCEQASKDFNVPLLAMVQLFFKYSMCLEQDSKPLDLWEHYNCEELPEPIEYNYDYFCNMLNEGWGRPYQKFSKLRYEILAIHNDSVEGFRNWLKQTLGIEPSILPTRQIPDYLDPDHPRYSPKLAAAIHAWIACEKAPKASAKSTLKKWLQEHAADFGLLNSDGKINETGVDETAKIANWNPLGGAPKTPTKS